MCETIFLVLIRIVAALVHVAFHEFSDSAKKHKGQIQSIP